MHIEYLFPTPVGNAYYNEDYDLTEYCNKLISLYGTGGQGWIIHPQNTSNIHHIHTDPKFNKITVWIWEQVQLYCNTLGYIDELKCQGSWINSYKQNNSQEFHSHVGSHFSCVFFLESEINDAHLIMSKLDAGGMYYTQSNKGIIEPLEDLKRIKPERKKLVIFKSSLWHMVEQKISDSPRITLAYNFVQKSL